MEPNLMTDNVSTRYDLVLERIRAGADRIDLDDVGAWDEDERVCRLGLPMICQRGLSRIEVGFYGSFLREMSRLMRRKEGPELALELELLVTKWTLRGLDQSLLQALVCHCHSELSGRGGATP